MLLRTPDSSSRSAQLPARDPGRRPLAGPGRRSARAGHTLPELLIVLMILSLLAVVALPRFLSAVVRSRLDTAFDQVREDLRFTRARTLSTGLRHQVMVDPQTGQIVVQPYRPELALGTQGAAATQPDGAPPALLDQLPQGVQIVAWEVSPVGLETGAAVQPQGAAATGPQALVFYPEGRADSAVLILEGPDGDRRGVAIDGFNGEMRELERDELQQQR